MTDANVASSSMLPIPVRYQASMETIGEHEAKTIQGLIETMEGIQTIVADDNGRAKRGVHAKAHGLLVGEFEVLPDLPPTLAQGLFATRQTYPAALRLSTIPGDVLDDAVSVPGGAALKIVGVNGPRASGSEHDVTQDFLFVAGKVFSAATPDAFLRKLKLLAVTTDRVPRLKKALSSVARGAEKIVEHYGAPNPTLLTLGGYPEINILGDEFYTQGPILYGDYIAKLALKPFSNNLHALTRQPLKLSGHPDGIRQAVVEFFQTNSAVWDIQVQLCTNLETMPIEDASVTWPETESPYRSVARLYVPAQDAWRADRVELLDERMSFSVGTRSQRTAPLAGSCEHDKPSMRRAHGSALTTTFGPPRSRALPPISQPSRNCVFRRGGIIMLRQTKVAVAIVVGAFLLTVGGTPDANADSKLPDPANAGVAGKLFRLDCGHSLANDESVWTPGENVGRSIAFSSTCWLIKHGNEWLLWDTGVPESALNDPRGWSTLPKLIVYHLDKTLTAQLAEIGLKAGDVTRVAISHTHGDHIGNMGLFPNSTVLMQQAEYSWIHSPNGPNDNVNQLMALARKLLGTPKNLQLIHGDNDVFGDGSVTLVSTPGHTPGHQSLLVHLRNSGFIILSGDVVHLEENFENNIVPSLNTNKEKSIASMERIRQMIATYKATLFINHDKTQTDTLKLLPAFYD